jgi:tricarballylate dehydrogenase
LHGTFHRIEGVGVDGPDGRYDIYAPVVILAAGGFQANPEMRARYLPPNADMMKVRGSQHNTGEVLQMALALGAGTAGQWSNAHCSLVSYDGPPINLIGAKYSRYSYPYGISVDNEGHRYADEGENTRMLTYFKMGWKALAQVNGYAWQIFDQYAINNNGDTLLRSGYFTEGHPFHEADTIAELAEKIGITPAVLQKTVDDYNAAVEGNDVADFQPLSLDGLGTSGLYPPKSNWALPIVKPPFRAYAVTAGITFTWGGLKVDTDARVLNKVGRPIEGLYASGDITGIFYHGYVGSTGQTRNLVFSRQAAKHAMATR